jgi:hypothetical protein
MSGRHCIDCVAHDQAVAPVKRDGRRVVGDADKMSTNEICPLPKRTTFDRRRQRR